MVAQTEYGDHVSSRSTFSVNYFIFLPLPLIITSIRYAVNYRWLMAVRYFRPKSVVFTNFHRIYIYPTSGMFTKSFSAGYRVRQTARLWNFRRNTIRLAKSNRDETVNEETIGKRFRICIGILLQRAIQTKRSISFHVF